MPNIVFYGGAGAGKTTCAEYLIQNHGYQKFSYATALKEIAARLWGDEAMKDRGKLQGLGKKLREIDEDVWLNVALRENVDCDPGVPLTNDDTRFPNEYWALKQRGFIFVRVLAREPLRVDRLLNIGKLQDPEQLNDESETALLGIERVKEGIAPDFTVFNEDAKEDLYNQIEGVLREIEAQT